MSTNLKTLRSIDHIIEANPLSLTDDLLTKLNPEQKEKAKINNAQIAVYKIRYKSQGHSVVGYITEPRKGNKLPCVIWNRGGSREFGAIQPEHIFINSIAKLALAGYLVIASQYSGNAGSEGIDEQGGSDLEDVLNLHKILKAYPRADFSRIGMIGSSRGGMMTCMALAKVKWIKAAVLRAPVTNLLHQMKNRPELKKLYKDMFGGSVAECKKRSVIFWVDRLPKKTPLLLMHGTADWRVNVADTLDLSKRLYEEHIPYRLTVYEGADHSLTEYNADAVAQSITWFDRFVKNGEKLPNLKLHGK